MSDGSGEIALTYAELGQRLGITADGARMKARRERWPVDRANDPRAPARVRVPAERLPEHPPEVRPNNFHIHPEVADHSAEIEANVERAERAEAELTALRGQVTELRVALAQAEGRLEVARVEAAARTETIDMAGRLHAAELAARETAVVRLEAELARWRLPWWRRWRKG